MIWSLRLLEEALLGLLAFFLKEGGDFFLGAAFFERFPLLEFLFSFFLMERACG